MSSTSDFHANARYRQGQRIAGVIYVFRIYPDHLTVNEHDGIRLLRAICGEEAYSSIRLVTTGWELCPHGAGISRERYLREGPWAALLHTSGDTRGGAKMGKAYDPASAWEVVRSILQGIGPGKTGEIFLVQKEMVAQEKSVAQSEVGRLAKIKDSSRNQEKQRMKVVVSMRPGEGRKDDIVILYVLDGSTTEER